MRYWPYALAVLAALIGLGWWQLGADTVDQNSQSATNASAFRIPEDEKIAGYARVSGPRPMRFPQDHGAHPDYRVEWWYFTGNLATPQGRPFGFELTFFRFAMAPSPPHRASDWATRQMWVGNFAISDIKSGEFHYFKRSQRGGALGLAGAQVQPMVRVWIDNWEVRALSTGSLFPARLHAEQEDAGIDLRLTSKKPLVLQGKAGYSRKGPDPQNASYYYSYTRLRAQGTLTVEGETYQVSGTAWMDREWSTSSLAPNLVGWDWLSLQLDDGRDLMLYRLRQRDGSASPYSYGVLVDQTGEPRDLSVDEFEMTPLRYWRSEATGVSYPVVWRVQVPSADLNLKVKARMPNQELNLRVRYWEGAVTASGEDVSGVGYLELTGYGSEAAGQSGSQADG